MELVRRGLAASRHQARDLVAAGRVTVGGGPALKVSRLVGPAEPVLVSGDGPRFVSRGGEKLAAGLERFAVPVEGARALDAGASTGGFTDCLLQHGARQVVAVDVGYGQLHERVRQDGRVEVHDRTNIREVQAGDLGEPFDVVVADLSFISLRLVLPHLLAQAWPGGHLVLLVKPQFEAGRQAAARGRGVIRDPDVWRQVLQDVRDALRARGAAIMDAMVSPLPGTEGNVEFLLHAVAPAGDEAPDTVTAVTAVTAVTGAAVGEDPSSQRRQADGSAPEDAPGIDVDGLVAEAARLGGR